MKNKASKGFTILEVLVAFVVATISIAWFFYVLSHNYATTSKMIERLHLFDYTTPFRKHLLTSLNKGSLRPDELKDFAKDEESLANYIITNRKISLNLKEYEKKAWSDFQKEYLLKEWQIIFTDEKTGARLFLPIYLSEEE
ncbi:type IV pilus modification PilV family protein [Thermodesulfatator autotrophicus]|uniref:Uncharacterized protein n=1 Tax=Thermodesulfatator autotrophicus TaxID=1795632 RepID=A0A177E8D5_9BACT|nr:prepilin-type N-terminal cleavage/methylation domain-containing protein [Thermodesulfatator autotrophicus]OAG28214.1 hypothetical protein TH606_02895 [Thermodesulfatator autotrophicus]